MEKYQKELLELRKAVIYSKLEGQPDSIKEAATKSLKHMVFENAADFMNYATEVTEQFSNNSMEVDASTQEEIDAVLDGIYSSPKTVEKRSKDSNVEDVFRHLGI